jgi:hypothetical protein
MILLCHFLGDEAEKGRERDKKQARIQKTKIIKETKRKKR